MLNYYAAIMSEKTAFIKSIIVRPDDDTLRLVYADWLQEHDDPQQAAFIRAQVSGAQYPETSRERKIRLDAARDLLKKSNGKGGKLRKDWMPDWPEQMHVYHAEFRRGLVAMVHTDIRGLADAGRKLDELAPVEEIRIATHTPEPLADRVIARAFANLPVKLKALHLEENDSMHAIIRNNIIDAAARAPAAHVESIIIDSPIVVGTPEAMENPAFLSLLDARHTRFLAQLEQAYREQIDSNLQRLTGTREGEPASGLFSLKTVNDEPLPDRLIRLRDTARASYLRVLPETRANVDHIDKPRLPDFPR